MQRIGSLVGGFAPKPPWRWRRVRKRNFTVRFSYEEFEALKEKARTEGITVSDLIRRAVLRVKPRRTPEECKRLLGHLGRIGNNLNQIARRANQQREVDLMVLEELRRIRKTLMEAVRERLP